MIVARSNLVDVLTVNLTPDQKQVEIIVHILKGK